METIAQQITTVLNKTFSGYIKAISEKYPNVPEDELHKIMMEILPGYKVNSFFSKKKEKKCKLDECKEMCIKGSLYCQAHKGGMKRKKTDEEKKEAAEKRKNKKTSKKKEKETKEDKEKEVEEQNIEFNENEEEEDNEEEYVGQEEDLEEKEKEKEREKEKEERKEKEREKKVEKEKSKDSERKKAPPKKKKTNTKAPRTAYDESDVEPGEEL